MAALYADSIGKIFAVGILITKGTGNADGDNKGIEDAPVSVLEEVDSVSLRIYIKNGLLMADSVLMQDPLMRRYPP